MFIGWDPLRQMKNLLLILLLTYIFSSCDSILEDPDNVRVGGTIEKELLTSQIWRTQYFNSEPRNGVPPFQESFMELNTDNTFDLINSEREIFTGQWALSTGNDLLVFRSDGKIPQPYSEIENEWVILNAEEDNIRIQERDANGTEEFDFSIAPDQEIPNVCEEVTKLIQDKQWRIQHLVVANSVKTSEYDDFEFTFDAFSGAVATTGSVSLEGSWNAGIRCNKFHFGFYRNTELAEISGLWQLSYFTESAIQLVMTRQGLNYEMKLISRQNAVNDLCQEAASTMMGGNWAISKFLSGNDDYKNDFAGYFFRFYHEGQLLAFNNNEELTGNWSLVNGCRQMPVSFETGNVLDRLNGSWQLVLISNESIKLTAQDDNVKREIQFTRDPASLDMCDKLDKMYEDDLTWHVSYYKANNENLTERMTGVSMRFSKDNTLIINDGDTRTNGSWELKDECEVVTIRADRSDIGSEIVGRLTLEWRITEAGEEKITLVHEGEAGLIEMHLTL